MKKAHDNPSSHAQTGLGGVGLDQGLVKGRELM
jgi:hypothetical protein